MHRQRTFVKMTAPGAVTQLCACSYTAWRWTCLLGNTSLSQQQQHLPAAAAAASRRGRRRRRRRRSGGEEGGGGGVHSSTVITAVYSVVYSVA
jgi:hypothetical protein